MTKKGYDEYSYDLDSNAGSIVINEETYSNIEKKINDGANNEFVVECNAGSIDISTK